MVGGPTALLMWPTACSCLFLGQAAESAESVFKPWKLIRISSLRLMKIFQWFALIKPGFSYFIKITDTVIYVYLYS